MRLPTSLRQPCGVRNSRLALVALSAVALSAGVATTSVSAQPAEDSLTRIRVDGSRARRVGTVLRITPDSAIVRLLYTERHRPRFADVVFWGTQRLLVDPPRATQAPDVLALARADVRVLERRGTRRAWPFTVLGAGLLGVPGLGVYMGGVTPTTVAVHSLLVLGGAAIGRSIGRKVGQHQWHVVPLTDWERLPRR